MQAKTNSPGYAPVGKPVQATLISLSRQVLFLLSALLILPYFFGVEGALWAGPVGDACASIMALAFGLTECARQARPSRQPHKKPQEGGFPMTHSSNPITINGLTLANRLVMPPMATAKADADGHVSDALCAYYRSGRTTAKSA